MVGSSAPPCLQLIPRDSLPSVRGRKARSAGSCPSVMAGNACFTPFQAPLANTRSQLYTCYPVSLSMHSRFDMCLHSFIDFIASFLQGQMHTVPSSSLCDLSVSWPCMLVVPQTCLLSCAHSKCIPSDSPCRLPLCLETSASRLCSSCTQISTLEIRVKAILRCC